MKVRTSDPSGSFVSANHRKLAPYWGQMQPQIKVEVQGGDIKVALRGTCLRAAFRKGDAPWLVWHGHGPDNRDATVTLAQFRALAWEAANS